MENKNTWRGFTLIELLVVVLIISILAAVAVPQYKKAVLKSRFSNLYPMARSLAQAQESFYLSAGDYAENLSALDVSVPGNPTGKTTTLSDGTQIKLGVEDNHIYVRSEKGDNALMIYQNHSPNFAGETHCEAKKDDTLANWLCEKGLDGTFVGNKYGYTIYSLSSQAIGTLIRTIYDDTTGPTLSDGDKCISTFSTQQTPTCQNLKLTDSSCEAQAAWGCREGEYKSSECKANGFQSCNRNTFTENSTCYGQGTDSCIGTFKHSSCISVGGQYNCEASTFTDYSKCQSKGGSTCQANKFFSHSFCKANASGACTRSKYDNTSFCTSDGEFCPAGTPKGTWNEATESYKLDGWNGGYCDPSAMTSGKCPAGSPTSTSGTCWDGDGNEVSCS